MTFTVLDLNNPPSITGPVSASVSEGDTLELEFTLSDPDTGAALTVTDDTDLFDITQAGTVFFTPGYDAAGFYSILLIVTDGYLSDTLTFSLTIENMNSAPEFTAVNDTSIYLGSTLQLQLQAPA